MKRVREDTYNDAHQRTRPNVSSPVESKGQPRIVKGGLTTGDALQYLKTVRDIFRDDEEKYTTFLEVMKDFKAQRLNTEGVIEKIKVLFKGYRDLLLGFNTFLPEGHRITLPEEEKKPKTRVDYKDAFSFVTKIKERLGGDEMAYKMFLNILDMYRKKRKSISDVYQEVTTLFKGHEDLLGEFVNFLPKGSESDSARNAVPRRKGTPSPAKHSDKKIKRQCKLEDSSEHSDQQEDCDENLAACSSDSPVKEGQRTYMKAEDNEGIRDYENREDTERDTDRTEKSASPGSKDIGNHNIPISTTTYEGTPINELDLSECTRCTPSYRLLPRDYQVEIPSYRNALGIKTLNDHLVSVTSGSEDYSFNHMRKNQYEESLFRCEDDRYEMDMLLGSVGSAIKNVETLLEKINNNTIKIDTICIEEHLSTMNLRCIERLYGDNGLDVMDLLKKNMHSALPVILTRLKQKQEEWTKCHSDFQKVWTEVYAKNHHKSLDHRSFYFKQQDSKNLSTKCLVAEIKDISEKKHQEDLLQAIAIRPMPSFTPDLEFNYCDTQIHEDLYLLIKYYCNEVCATEQSNKVMKLWTTFLEPMFGVFSRSQSHVAMEDASKLINNNQESDACVAVKDSTSELNHKDLASPKQLNKDDPTLQGSSPRKDVSAHVVKTVQHDQLQDDSPMTDEVIQPSKLVSPKKYQLMEDVENHRSDEVLVGKHASELEEGELSPDNSSEQGNLGNDEQNDLKPSQRVMDNGCVSLAGEVSNGNEGEDGSFASSELFLQTVKPVAKHMSWPFQATEIGFQNVLRVFYGNDSYYVLLRLHQMLYKRIQTAKKHSEKKCKASDNTTPDSYSRFMEALYALLDGSGDNAKFEEECRALFGAQSYVFFTLDKLVHKFVKHLHAVAADETDTKLLQLYAYENHRKQGRFLDPVYHENARAILREANIYRIRYSSAESNLSIQLMNNWNNHHELTGTAIDPSFADYLQNKFLTSVNDEEKQGLFLRRNKVKFGLDESSRMSVAMEGLNIVNELEYKMTSSSTSKVKYVPNTSDILYRRKPDSKRPGLKKVSEISKERRVSRFHIMLNCRLVASPPP